MRVVYPTHWNLDLVLNTDPSKEAQAFLSTNAATLSSSPLPRGTECANLLNPPKDADRHPPLPYRLEILVTVGPTRGICQQDVGRELDDLESIER